MKICHVCAAECADDAELCPVCGAELKAAEEYAESPEEIIINNPVLAASVEDVVTAEIFRDTLREHGIVFTCDEPESSMRVVFGGSFIVEDVYVDEDDLEEAQRLYAEVLEAEPEFLGDFEEETEESDEEDEDSEEEADFEDFGKDSDET